MKEISKDYIYIYILPRYECGQRKKSILQISQRKIDPCPQPPMSQSPLGLTRLKRLLQNPLLENRMMKACPSVPCMTMARPNCCKWRHIALLDPQTHANQTERTKNKAKDRQEREREEPQ